MTTLPNEWLRSALGLCEKDTPFPWQEELLKRFVRGAIPPALDIPTGLGKTAVMAIWLVARVMGAALPRRLVYVVDRRAVVDQATVEAERLRAWVGQDPAVKAKLGLTRPLPISTLRGQHVDNREWLEDPAAPAIIVGTVDMVGSRLLFEGYGVSPKMRPYHAGLLGADTLLVLDEAHLVASFEKLLDSIAQGGNTFGPRGKTRSSLVPSFRLLSLSATGRSSTGESLTLTNGDRDHPVVRERLEARKGITLVHLGEDVDLTDELAGRAWKLAGHGTRPVRCIVFCDRRADAEKVLKALDQQRQRTKALTELFVGGRRVFEREEAARRLSGLGFIAGSDVAPQAPVFLVATSAAEVGVDLDADHMVCDLVAWERMVQRLGRVNRRGKGAAEVVVCVPQAPKPTRKQRSALDKAEGEREDKDRKALRGYEACLAHLAAYARPFEHLPRRGDAADGSPAAIVELRRRSHSDSALAAMLRAATTPAPLRPALTRPLVDAWSMTSLERHPGRPEIDPWLRGWVDDDPPRTSVVWRAHLPVRTDGKTPDTEVEAFFEAAAPHAVEILETETYQVVDWLVARARALLRGESDHGLYPESIGAMVLDPAGELRRCFRLAELADNKDQIEAVLRQGTLIVDRRIGGLANGLLDAVSAASPATVDDDPDSPGIPRLDGAGEPRVRFRTRLTQEVSVSDGAWRERLRLAVDEPEDGDTTWLLVEKWKHDGATEDDRSSGRPQLLIEHQEWTEDEARSLAKSLGLDPAHTDTLGVAARLHDEGKRARRWQRAFHAAPDGPYAKTLGPVNAFLLDGYRHELGSLPYAERDERFRALPEELRDLALHLVAAHHGYARPVIRTSGCEDAPPSALEARACEIALRFARLQRRWGPWGLAWWEALLRAADQRASRRNDEFAKGKGA
jgi:CRISPR-associated endonuclease/helicase Cas3